jgi:hypothetical protein
MEMYFTQHPQWHLAVADYIEVIQKRKSFEYQVIDDIAQLSSDFQATLTMAAIEFSIFHSLQITCYLHKEKWPMIMHNLQECSCFNSEIQKIFMKNVPDPTHIYGKTLFISTL